MDVGQNKNNFFFLCITLKYQLYWVYVRNFVSDMINEKICFIQARYKQSFVTMNCNTTYTVVREQMKHSMKTKTLAIMATLEKC